MRSAATIPTSSAAKSEGDGSPARSSATATTAVAAASTSHRARVPTPSRLLTALSEPRERSLTGHFDVATACNTLAAGVTGSNPIALVERATRLFNEVDDRAFVDSFHPRCRIYSEPQLVPGEVLQGREALREWIGGVRPHVERVQLTLQDAAEHSGRVVGDVLVVSGPEGAGSGWRVSFAMWFAGDLISEARLFWDRQAAVQALEESP